MEKRYDLKFSYSGDQHVYQGDLLGAVVDYLESVGIYASSLSIREVPYYTQEELDDQKNREETREEVKGVIKK